MAPVAAIDVGTNSTRLLIRDLGTGETLERRQTITRLGKGTDASGLLDPAAIERTVVTIREYQALIEQLRDSSQLIIITHQKRTMQVADALYGVSMRGDGITQVVGQRLREIEPAS